MGPVRRDDGGLAKNMAKGEQWGRMALGAVLLGMALFCPWAASIGPALTWPAGIVGAAGLLTGAFGWCPLYGLLARG